MKIKQLFILIWLSSFLFSGCATRNYKLESSNSSIVQKKSGWIKRDLSNNSVIVFVHGVIGDPYDTWFNKETNNYWPKLVAEDADFDGVNIYTYGYSSALFEKTLSISSLASEMKERLQADGVLSQSKIIFVAHSMGGIVVRQFLLRNRESVANNVGFIYFLATPTTGSYFANLASIFSFNPQFKDMALNDLDGYATNVILDWQASTQMRDIPSYCVFESKNIGPAPVVPFYSASNLCNREIFSTLDNHIDIAKPNGRNALQYKGLKNAFFKTNVNRIQCGSQQNDHPIIEFDKPIEEQLQLFSEDKIRFISGEAKPEQIWLGYVWENFEYQRDYLVSGVPGQPVLPQFRGGKMQAGMKLEVNFCRYLDRRRDLRDGGHSD